MAADSWYYDINILRFLPVGACYDQDLVDPADSLLLTPDYEKNLSNFLRSHFF